MDTGTCVGCGAEDMEINDDGYCTTCADLEGENTEDDDTLGGDDLDEEEA